MHFRTFRGTSEQLGYIVSDGPVCSMLARPSGLDDRYSLWNEIIEEGIYVAM